MPVKYFFSLPARFLGKVISPSEGLDVKIIKHFFIFHFLNSNIDIQVLQWEHINIIENKETNWLRLFARLERAARCFTPSKHEKLNQCRVNLGPLSTTPAQH